MQKKRHRRPMRMGPWPAAAVIAFLAAGIFLLSYDSLSHYRAATTSTHICVGVAVIGPDGGDPGSFVCNPPTTEESSASSEASSSSAAADAASSVPQPSGGRRHSVHQSHWRIVRLLEQWTRRHSMHAAPGEPPCSEPFNDVHDDAWYFVPVRDFFCEGILAKDDLFRPGESATRAEMAKLLVLVRDASLRPPSVPSFDDAPDHAWYFAFVESAAEEKWMIGYGDCLGTHPCFTRPAANVTRAEAAALVIRAFDLQGTSASHAFTDVPPYAWYVDVIDIAADRCVLRGDDGSRRMRPEDPVSRAEMATMIWRARRNGENGGACDDGVGSTPTWKSILAQGAEEVMVASLDGGMQSSFVPSACITGVWACLMDAVSEDARRITSNVLASLLTLPDGDAIRSSSGEEVIAWCITFIGLLLAMAFVKRVLRL